MNRWIGISLGDVTGIGPEVTLKALAAEPADASRYLLLGDSSWVNRLNTQLGLKLQIEPFTNYEASGRLFVHNPLAEPLQPDLTPGSPAAASASVSFLEDGARRCLRHELAALVTAPVNKESIVRTGIPFVGQTELLSQIAGAERTVMMLLGPDEKNRWLRVALVTAHLALKHVAEILTPQRIQLTIELAAKACSDLRLPRARVAVCGLNPHAGEGGTMGTEEIEIIAPAVAAMKEKGVDVHGPFAADTLFYHAFKGDYDAVVVMYHDQGLVPLKMVAFENGINWTLGLPFIRTSPDHGTAYDIAGKNKANSSSMTAALRLAKQLAATR